MKKLGFYIQLILLCIVGMIINPIMGNKIVKVFIDPGHGGLDPGATFGKLIEKDINLTVAIKLAKLLRFNGFDVKLSRETDVFINLAERSRMANAWGCHIFISIHHNAAGGDGFEVIHSVHKGKDDRLARIIGEEFAKLGQNKHGTGTMTHPGTNNANIDYLSVLRLTTCDARALTEYAYLDNEKDNDIVDTIPEQVRESYGLAFAVCRYVGVRFRDIA